MILLYLFLFTNFSSFTRITITLYVHPVIDEWSGGQQFWKYVINWFLVETDRSMLVIDLAYHSFNEIMAQDRTSHALSLFILLVIATLTLGQMSNQFSHWHVLLKPVPVMGAGTLRFAAFLSSLQLRS